MELPILKTKRRFFLAKKIVLFLFGVAVYHFIGKRIVALRKKIVFFIKKHFFLFFVKNQLLPDNKIQDFVHNQKFWFYGEKESLSLGKPISFFDEISPRMRVGQTISYQSPRPYVCEINNVLCMGKSMLAMTKNGFILPQASAGVIMFPEVWAQQEIVNFLRSRYAWSHLELESAFSLVSTWCWNYFHWMFDALASLRSLVHYEQVTGVSPTIIVPNDISKWQIDLLQLAGFSLKRCLYWDSACTRINTLIVSSTMINNDYDVQQPEYCLRPSACYWLRDRILSNMPGQAKQHYDAKIFISRVKSRGRKIINEDQIMDVLGPMGFKKICPEDMTVHQQIMVFSHAKVIVGCGAGLTNIMFSNQPIVIELLSDSHLQVPMHYYFQLSTMFHAQYGVLTGTAFNEAKHPYWRDFVVDARKLSALIRKL
ncbi:MAG: glycosyltransferase family 61 protein [Candidatus Omnitrophica bacterium]|nr:glycosyltransferase family 61 protein [Candidatus Omnitrophota bacterium]